MKTFINFQNLYKDVGISMSAVKVTNFDFSGSDLEAEVKLPYIVKDRTLMSPGTWNNYKYTSEEIEKAFFNTNWEDKDIRALYYEHEDGNKDEKGVIRNAKWLGEVINPRIEREGDNAVLKGDLLIVNKQTAVDIHYGARYGVSPRCGGPEHLCSEGSMMDFKYKNFSIVKVPAIKTAYINNSKSETKEESINLTDVAMANSFENSEDVEVNMELSEIRKDINEIKEIVTENAKITAMEEKRKSSGISVSQFYAIPRDPPGESKLPIFDAAHVRNALARFNQIKGVSAEERAKAKRKILSSARKFGIKVSSDDKKMEDEIMEEKKEIVEELPEKSSDEAGAEKVDAESDVSKEEDKASEVEETQVGEESSEDTKEESEKDKEVEEKKEAEESLSKKVVEDKSEKVVELMKSELLKRDEVISELASKVEELDKKLREPEVTQELSDAQVMSDPRATDKKFLNYLKELRGY